MSDAIQKRLLNELASNLASAFEGMTGDRPQTTLRGSATAPESGLLRRRQTFSGVPGAIWIAAAETDWMAGGGLVLQAAGLSESDPEKYEAEFQEILQQSIAGVARAMSHWLGREVRPGESGETAALGISWSAIEVRQGDTQFYLLAAVEPDLSAAFAQQEEQALEPVRDKPPTFDLLLDVELPISVSFGRAEVPLKDVLKLTTGSIIELNRAIADQVEVIVNNCVIARGEVVTVEGNFGVRIQEVVSRQERWKTLG